MINKKTAIALIHCILKRLYAFFGCILEYQPLKLEKTVADPKSWIYLECGATEKFFVNGSHKQNLPSGLFSSQNFGFIRAELESGYFAIQMLPDDNDEYGEKKITKVCSQME